MSKATKKVRDKWRAKEWYSVFTPSYFGEQSVAVIPSEDPKKLIGRVVETTLYDITNDFSHQSTKLYFLVVSITGEKCETILKNHEYSTDYARSRVRRIQGSQEHAVQRVMGKIVAEKASKLTYSQLSHEMVLGKMGSDVYNEAKKVCPLRHVGVRKSKLLSMPLTATTEPVPTDTVVAPEAVVPA